MTKHLDEGYLELFQLSESLKDKSTKLYRRSMMVLLVLYLGYSQSAAAKQLGTTAKTVGKWVHRYLENGKNGLLDAKRSGRPRRIQDKMRDLIVQIAQTDPILITDHLSNWSLQTLQRYLLQVYLNSISISSIHRILKDHGIRFRVVEETMLSPDPEYQIKKQRIEDAKVEADKDEEIVFLSLDEKGPIHALYHRGKKWMNDLVRHQIPRNHNKSNGKVVLNAAFEPATNKFWWHFSERRTGDAFLTLLLTLSMDLRLQTMKKVYLVMDNLPAHFTQNIKDLLALHPKFKVLRLPTYSPELNPIERVFSDINSQVIQNHYFSTTQQLEDRIDSWLQYRMTLPIKEIKPVSAKKTHRQRLKKILLLV